MDEKTKTVCRCRGGPALYDPVTVEIVEWRKTHCGLENGSHGVDKEKENDYKQ